jgi:hypothetical protein
MQKGYESITQFFELERSWEIMPSAVMSKTNRGQMCGENEEFYLAI